ncbi:PREDICTED: uncharacterized protein LOC104352819, partial [Leptosomus discolor]|uniref:uncharacterized protein LOC104352819 n=1 Tax=Leptosomus discolor TaxID=188344 RepID=UPI0005228ED4
AMCLAVALILAVLASQHGVKCNPQIDVATAEQMQWREKYLNQQMTRLLQAIEGSRVAQQGIIDMCKVLKELVDDLLGVCRVLCKKTSMPQMHRAVGINGSYEGWLVEKDSIVYRLLVFLQPPPGHSFSLELDTMGQLPARTSSIYVGLQCMCLKEQLLSNTLCFLHHRDDKLRRDRSSYVLCTLCTGFYLDVEKIAFWAQRLAEASFTSSTPWPEICAAVEMQLFRLMAWHTQQDNFHLRVLQLCARILSGHMPVALRTYLHAGGARVTTLDSGPENQLIPETAWGACAADLSKLGMETTPHKRS